LKEFIDIFRKQCGLRHEVFELSSTHDMANFTNTSKTISSNQDEEEEEEVWMEQLFVRGGRYGDEYISKGGGNDKNMEPLYKQFMNLITQGSAITGELSHIRI
jgi:hypothetical protein